MKGIILTTFMILATVTHAKVERFEAFAFDGYTTPDGYVTPVSGKKGEKWAIRKAQRALEHYCVNEKNGVIVDKFETRSSYCEERCSIGPCAEICTAVVYGNCKY